ncbi:MAG: hypothetical protein EON58_10660 [Alphaproteobacteria bacterium]|nr:MAG: hypothetical protein EON58_10660 [Alphaproteobacteria bacterium]
MKKSTKLILAYLFISAAVLPLQNQELPAFFGFFMGSLSHLGMIFVKLVGIENLDGHTIVTSEDRIAAVGYAISWIIGLGLVFLAGDNVKARGCLIFFWLIAGLVNFYQLALHSV